jgi:hypothetical protein
VLSDTAVGGEYLTLTFNRPGNTIALEAFDGLWAVVTITTRAGNRPGDNVRARLYLRDDDLKVLGMDSGKIIARNGLPFSFPVETLANNGLFEDAEPEAYAPVEEDDPPPPVVTPGEPVLAETRWAEPEPAPEPQPELEPAPVPFPQPAAWEPEPPPEPAPALAAEAALPEPDAAEPDAVVLDPMPAEATPRERLEVLDLFAALRAGRALFGGNQLLEIGAAVGAVATPVVFYLLLSFLRGKPKDDDKS